MTMFSAPAKNACRSVSTGSTLGRTMHAAMLSASAIAIGSVCALPDAALAQTNTSWVGGVSSDWFLADNWGGSVPVAGDTAHISTPPGSNVPILQGATPGYAHEVYVGSNGVQPSSGYLRIENGGVLNSTHGLLGHKAGSTTGKGTVQVSGPGSEWNNAGNMIVGDTYDGTLRLRNGAKVTSQQGFIGNAALVNGFADLRGNNTKWINTNDLSVGEKGIGVLFIVDGATVENSDGYVGSAAGAQGRVSVGGTNAKWINAQTLTIAYEGVGSLAINSGGAVSNTDGYVGSETGSDGSVYISDTGSTWTSSQNLYLGDEGKGRLTVESEGVVSAASIYLGDMPGSEGQATISGAGSQLNATYELDVGSGGKGTLTLTDNGTASAGTEVYVQRSDGSSGTLNIGAASGDAAATAGNLSTPKLYLNEPGARLVFNHTNTGYLFNPDMFGTGQFLQESGETIYTGDGAAFTGSGTVSGGRFLVNGTLGGVITVDGGVLGGSGTLETATINAGGTLAPGNSIGTLNAASANFHAGSVFEVELNDGGNTAGTNNDHLNVSGAVAIDAGTIHVKPENGTDDGSTYTPGLTYTIISAGSVAGQFTAVTDDYPLLDFTDSYSGTNVFLTSSQSTGCPAGMTFNQTSTCGGVLSIGSGGLHAAVLNLGSAELPGALDQLSGEIYASTTSALLEDSRFPREAANDRLRRDYAAAGTLSTPILAYGEDAREMNEVDQWPSLWAHAFGADAKWKSDGNAAKTDRTIGGLLVGADAFITEGVQLGLLAGYSRSAIDVNDRVSSGDADSWHLGVYGGKQWGDFSLRGGAAFAWHALDTSRAVAFTGFNDALAGEYNASTMQFFGEAGYRLEANTMRFEPYAGVAHVRLKTGDFSETGGGAALTVAGTTIGTTFTNLGLRAGTELALGGKASVELTGGIGWQHAFGDTDPATQMQFAGGDVFTIAGVPVARDMLALDLEARVALTPAARLGLSYSGRIASDAGDHGLKATLGVTF
ncbi:outer membrane autotransporter barrel domain-containing protein [Nitratireductor aquibiodomus]|uniref:Outer membrane autotransporter barrel domain-containing protein n=2 Tax=Nitratireductor aquibiodomus TaxID=204799 RepID=A0A1H4LPB1_9HYPH|nr:outer membrane autotransporter barrel domain-containing protein [Nitratireductor aquibiodomus]